MGFARCSGILMPLSILPGIDLPTAAAAQALTANEEALQGGTRGKAERTAFTQAALAALGAE